MAGGADQAQFKFDFGQVDALNANLRAASSKLQARLDEIKQTADRATAEWQGAAMAAYREASDDMRQAGEGLKGIMDGVAGAIEKTTPEVRSTDNQIADLFRR